MEQYRQEAEQIAATVAAHQRGERLDRIELEALMRRSLEILKELWELDGADSTSP